MPETYIIPRARTRLGGRRPPSGLGIKGERRLAKVFRKAKFGRDVKQRSFKIEKRNTDICTVYDRILGDSPAKKDTVCTPYIDGTIHRWWYTVHRWYIDTYVVLCTPYIDGPGQPYM
jgi:hypothetical protein